jgi:hypothetical protein
MPDPVTSVDRHVEVEMTGDRSEDARRRAAAAQVTLIEIAQDPLVKLRMALGRAYSDCQSGVPAALAAATLRAVVEEDAVAAVAPGYLRALADTVAARSVGEDCGCHISKVQLALLLEAMARPEITRV